MSARRPALLLTQCLQNDFVASLGRHDALPNALHIGHEEARRLMGEASAEGPVARVMRWAAGRPSDELKVVHIRDWHDPADRRQAEHLRQFGAHCVLGTPGAAFAFETGPAAEVVDSLTLNDFLGTRLAEVLAPHAVRGARAGLIGVWTEAKVTYLAYELRTRYPDLALATCSALTASSSRARHFEALDQLERLLGVKVFPSMGEFLAFLGGEDGGAPLALPTAADHPTLTIEGVAAVSETDRTLLRHLFRDSKTAHLRCLDGGFSGNLVLGSRSVDLHGHEQASHVVKIGPVGPIGQERTAFERVESVLGNSAPRVADFADLAERGAIKYRYAAMGGGFSTTFQKRYMAGLPLEQVRKTLHEVFVGQLGRFYRAAERERCNLLDYYCFRPDVGPRVRQRVQALCGPPDGLSVSKDGTRLRFPGGRELPHPALFYERDLPEHGAKAEGSSWFSFVHGDLNGANIILDAHENLWLIDFFHAHRGHALKDLAKLENDLLYIFTPVPSTEALDEAFRLTDALLTVEDLARALPEPKAARLKSPDFARAWETVRILRSFHADIVHSDRNPLQFLIAQLRYAMHTLSFDESDRRQKLWALYAGAGAAVRIGERLRAAGPLRVDWLDGALTGKGRLGITLLPGRKDYRRDLGEDVAALKREGVSRVACLVSDAELTHYGVEGLLKAYAAAGLEVERLPILDQKVPSPDAMRVLAAWLTKGVGAGRSVVVHCVGGLGRAGLAAACWLRAQGLSADAALAEVRRARGSRAVETRAQEDFVRAFEP